MLAVPTLTLSVGMTPRRMSPHMRSTHDIEHENDQYDPDSNPPAKNGEDSEWDEIDPDDPCWDAFVADDDERNPEPEFGDFWPAE
jgi:hypothetical protein